MAAQGAVSLMEHFADLPDPRAEYNRRHEWLDIMVIAICAVLAGSERGVDIEVFGKSKEAWRR